MIDWWFVAVNGLWIFGASIVVAAFSYHRWLAIETGRRMRAVFRERSWQISYPLGALLFCIGWLLGVADRWWERSLWGVLAASFCWQMIGGIRMPRSPSTDESALAQVDGPSSSPELPQPRETAAPPEGPQPPTERG